MENTNLISNQLPLEVEKWRNSELITDGNFELDYHKRNYAETGKDDFRPEKPKLTYDLGNVQDISVIGIVFYRDKSDLPGKEKRKYTFSLEISINGDDWIVLREEMNEFSFSSLVYKSKNKLKARYVRFSNFTNNLNNSIHVVEIEINSNLGFRFDYDRVIEFDEIPLTPSFLDAYILDSLSNSNELINNLTFQLEKKIDQTSSIYDDLLKERETINNSINQLNILGSLREFKDEAKSNKVKSYIWLSIFTLLVLIFFSLLICFFYYDNFLDLVFKIDDIQERNIRLISHYVSRGLLFSFLIYLINTSMKNFKNEKHNYTVNTHKALSLRVILELRNKENDKNIKDQLLLKSIEIILSHQDSGYSKGSENNNPIVTSIIENISKNQVPS